MVGRFGGGDTFQGRQGDFEDFALKEQKGVAGDVLGRRGDVFFDGQVGEGVANRVRPEGGGVPFAVEDDEASDGGQVAVFGVQAEVLEAEDSAGVFQKRVEVAWAGVVWVRAVGAVPGGSFLERSSSVGLCFCGLFGIMFPKAASRRPVSKCVAAIAAGSGALYLDPYCDLLFLECGQKPLLGRVMPRSCGAVAFLMAF